MFKGIIVPESAFIFPAVVKLNADRVIARNARALFVAEENMDRLWRLVISGNRGQERDFFYVGFQQLLRGYAVADNIHSVQVVIVLFKESV